MKPERVKEIYSSLERLIIELDPDPSARGYKYLQDLIARTRGFLNEASIYLVEVLRERHLTELDLQAEESAFEIRADELLASDSRVSRLPNIDDRKAMINVILGDDRRRIQSLRRDLKNLGHVEKVIRHRHKELENSMSGIRLQRSLVETEARTGSFYGDESEAPRGKTNSTPEFDDEELRSLFDDASTELTPCTEDASEADLPDAVQEPPITLEESVVAEPASEPQAVHASTSPKSSDEDPDIGKFLDGDDDLEGLFDSI